VFQACAELPAQMTWDIVVAVDSSSDLTREIAERMLCGLGAVVCTDAGAVGQSRALAVEAALARYGGDPETCWLANTDADCCVPVSWLTDQLALAVEGAEAVAGVIDVDSFAEHSAGVAERFRATYLIYADGTHPHVHGANLGIRADAYLRAGGWSEMATAEDHDLWHRLRRAGSRRISAARVKVTTSGRRVGRAPMGFAGALAAHNEGLTNEVSA
jgi:hypothetical protein